MSIESLPSTREQNHFNLLRLIAASAVIWSHAYSLALGGDAPDPLQRLAGIDLGTTAVLAFFAISGYFITLSFDRRPSNWAFVFARATRIWPGLLVVSLLSAFVLGPLITDLSSGDYFRSPAVWLYPAKTMSFTNALWDPLLPGVFMHNPAPGTVNGALWTLFYEVSCYAGLFIVGVLGLLTKRRYPWLVAAWFGAYLFARYGPFWRDIAFFGIFSVPFVIGVTVYHYRWFLNGWLVGALAVLALALGLSGHFVEELWSVAVAYGVLCLGFAPMPFLLPYNRVGDFSYGTYIYGFPVDQTVVALLPGIAPTLLLGLSLPISIMSGALSWFLIERPSLTLRKRLTSAAAPLRQTGRNAEPTERRPSKSSAA